MYMAVSETAKSHGKSGAVSHAGRKAALLAAAALIASGMFGMAEAADKDIVDKGAQPIAYDISPANDGTNIAIGKNAKVFIGGGTQESMLSFGETVEGSYSMNIHNNNHAKQNLPEAIAVGTNSYARTGAIEIGAHTLAANQIAIGDTTADQLRQFGVASTTLGTNSYTGGGFATTIGSYNVQTNQYEAKDPWDTLDNATKNAFSTVIGTFNSNESMTGSSSSGVANMISGMANKVTNSNGAIVMGAGNSVKESSSYIDASPYSTHFDSVADMQKALMDGVASSAGGATLVIGGANSAEKTQNSQIMGVGNSMKSTTYRKVQYNYLDGFNSSITDASHVKVLGQGVTIKKGADSNTVIGDYRTVAEDQTHNVIIGNADEKTPITTKKKDTVILGHNANATVDGGVALGAGSVASVDEKAVGYDPSGTDHSGDTTGIWKSKAAAVSVGNKNFTRQITNVAAGTQDTDAVNVAQLKAVSTASKTKYYSVRNIPYIADQLGTYAAYTNEKNDGAKEMGALAAGYLTYAGGIASTVTGSLSGVINQAAAPGSQDFRGATALSYGTFNINNNTAQSGLFSGVANSIVGQANMTTDSNAALIYGAGNVISNSYRKIDITKMGAITGSLTDPKALGEALQAAVPTSGGQVMAFGGGNVVDNAYMTQVMGVGNTVKGNQKKNNDGTWTSKDNTGFNDDASSQLNYVDGFYTTLINGKSDYLIGAHNTVTGDSVEKNHSNIVIGDNHTLENQSNNIILGSADSTLPTTVSQVTIVGHNANATVEGGVAIGSGSVASVDKGVEGYKPNSSVDTSTDPAGTWKSTDAAVSVGKADGSMTRQITGVAAGTKATDAVNVAQLTNALSGAKDGNDTLKPNTNALTLHNNTLSMSVEDTAGHTVSGSVDLSQIAQAVDTNTTYTLSGQANQDNTTTITLKDSNGRENSVTVATKDTDTRNTVKAGENVTLDTKDNADGSHEYTVHVKADGKVEAGSTKIVSGGTVYNETRVQKDGTYVKASNTAGENLTALDSQVASNASGITNLNGRVNRLDSRINKVGAGAAALAALHPLDFNPDDKWDFAVGYGNYRNANSVALGAFYRPNENTMLSLGTNFGNGENMFNAGVSFKIGKGNSYAGYSKVEMAKVIDTQSREVAALKEENAKNAKDNAVMKAEIEALKKQVEALAAKK